jgi:uncharacterized protein DUF3500
MAAGALQPEGIKGSALTERQWEMLLDLDNEWTGIMHEAVAKAKMDEMKQHIAETWFAWSGPTEKGRAAVTAQLGHTRLLWLRFSDRQPLNHVRPRASTRN